MGKLIFMRRFWEYGKRMKIRKLFEDNSKIWNRQPLFDAVWKKDTETATKEMNKLLRKTISYHDYKEDFYHAFLAGIFAGAGYMVEYVISFLIAVTAGVACHYIIKWLDGDR